MSTVQEQLNLASPTTIADMFRKVVIGDILAGLVPTLQQRTGLAANAVQVEPSAGAITAVESPTGTALTIVGPGVAPGATEVSIAYDVNGVATLTFAAPVTDYDVVKTGLPADLGDILQEPSGAST